MPEYRPRWLAPLLRSATERSPVVIVTGARQVGKSTMLLAECAEGFDYLSLDDFENLEQARRNPDVLLERSDSIILDEVQRAPQLLTAVKRAVDLKPTRRFILSGSANMLLMAQASESLAGRAEFLDLAPLSIGERDHHAPPTWFEGLLAGQPDCIRGSVPGPISLASSVWRGGMPVTLQRTDEAGLVRWREGYVRTYLERDLRQLSQIEHLSDFRRLMVAAALRCGQLVNASAIGRDIGLSQPTTHRYLALLEVSLLMHRLPAYADNRGVRLMKSPKIMWCDSGIAAHLAGFYSADDLRPAREWGGILETFVFAQLSALASLVTPTPRLYYWRTRKGEEVDFIVEYGRRLLAIEVKSAKQVRYSDTTALQLFLKTYPETVAACVLYAGTEVRKMASKLYAIPFAALWDEPR